MEHTDLEEIKSVVHTMAETAVANEKYFSDLDAVVGDGDFGFSLARGFEQLLQDWDKLEYTDSSSFLKKVALMLTSRIGGTSGPIWGTAFLRAATTLGDKQEIGRQDVIAMLRAAIEGIKQRGKAELGDKTLLDALIPATDQLEKALSTNIPPATALAQAAAVARERAESTRELLAKRGRASYSGDRSIGTLDAGAIAVAVMFEQVSQAWT